MIKKIILPLIAILLLSSCANKFSLQKRKYTKGYYFATSKNNSSKTNNADVVKHNKAKNLETKATALDISGQEKQIIEQPIINVENSYISTNLKKQNKKVSIITSANKTSFNTVVAKEFKTLNISTTKISETKKGSGSDSNLILLIILCFLWFFNLIAIYIKDGKKLTLNFLVTLLLDFTLIGGIIFSLLVVLDVVNLA